MRATSRAEPFKGHAEVDSFMGRAELEGSIKGMKQNTGKDSTEMFSSQSTGQEKPTMSSVLFCLPSDFQSKAKKQQQQQHKHFEPLSEFDNMQQLVSWHFYHSLCTMSKTNCLTCVISLNSPHFAGEETGSRG